VHAVELCHQTLSALSTRFYIPHARRVVDRFCRSCVHCRRRSPRTLPTVFCNPSQRLHAHSRR
jgi:hypothetical protein